MKKLITLILALTLALAFAVPAAAAKIAFSASNGTVVLDDAVAEGSVSVGGRSVPVYATTPWSYIWKIGLKESTVFTVSRFTLNGDGTGKVGDVLRTIDKDYYARNNFTSFSSGSRIYYYAAFDKLVEQGVCLYFEIKEAGEGENSVTRFVTRNVAGTILDAPAQLHYAYGAYDMGKVKLESAGAARKTLTFRENGASVQETVNVVSVKPGTGFVGDIGEAPLGVFRLKNGSYQASSTVTMMDAQTIDDVEAAARSAAPDAEGYLYYMGYGLNGMKYFLERGGETYAATAMERSQTIELDGKTITMPSYALADANGYETNYIKLRDLASLLSHTSARFNVGWDMATNAVTIQKKTAYVPNGSEMKTPFSGDRAYQPNTAPVLVNGAAADLHGIVLTDDNGGGYTYFKLRDVGAALGFNVGWDETRGIYIESGKPYVG